MEQISVFNNPMLGELRTLGTSENPMFCVNDLCKILGYANARAAISRHVDSPDVTKRDIGVVTSKKIDGTDAVQIIPMNFVNESGLYALIFGSIFNSPQFGQLRTIGSSECPLFAAADLCKMLGYSNTSKAVKDNTEPEERYNYSLERGGKMLFITESGLYSLILRSNKPEAKVFKRWVTAEVLPSIRKAGAYISDQRIKALEAENESLRKRIAPHAGEYRKDILLNNRPRIGCYNN